MAIQIHDSFPDIASGGQSEHSDSEGTQIAGDVVPISSGRTEQYKGQNGVINSTGDIGQLLNDSPWRKASDRTNVIPLRKPGQ